MRTKIKSWVYALTGLAVSGGFFYFLLPALAGSLSPLSDTISSLSPSAPSDHAISLRTTSGLAAGETLTIDFSDGWSNLGAITADDLDLAVNGVDLPLATDPAGAVWGARFTGSVLTFTSDTDTVAPGATITVEIGQNASHQIAGLNRIVNPDTLGAHRVLFGGTFGDSGAAYVFITNDNAVNIGATVEGGGGPTCDSDAPAITNVQVISITDTTAVVTWLTNEAASSLVRYGLTAAYESGSENNVNLETSHALTLSGLSPFTTYHYRVESTDNCANTSVSGDLTFTTTGPAGLSVRVLPEKRWPSDGNFRTHLNIKIYRHGTSELVLERQVDTDNMGYATGIDISSLALPGAYDFLIKGYSHLKYRKDNVSLTLDASQFVDFSVGSTVYVKAGDTNGTIGDNYVNGMDLSTIAREIYDSTEREDLNLDGIINGIEFAIAVTNLYVWGHD